MVERKRHAGQEVAPLVVADQRLGARGRVLHRAAELPRRPQHEAVLDVDAVLCAEVAADVERDHAQPVGRKPENLGELAALAKGPAAAGVEDIAPAGGFVDTKRRARLDRHAGHAAHVELARDHVIGAGERGIDRRLFAPERGVDANVRGHLVPHGGALAFGRVRGVDHERQRVPRHAHRRDRVFRLSPGLGHDHRDGLAHMTRLVRRQQNVWTDEDRAAVRGPELEIVTVRRHGTVRDGAEPLLGDVRAREDSEHAGHRPGLLALDCDDAGVRVRRADDRRVDQAGEREVVAIPSASSEQAVVFLAAERLADGAGCGRTARHARDCTSMGSPGRVSAQEEGRR